ncbi:MAG: permease-like cell division protein FtsX, partial [Deinococcus sp.]|nr:permease-like cell division protein FtsX [Deinococcus sp.]
GAVLLAGQNLNRTLAGLERQVEVAAFLEPGADGAALLRHAQGMAGVAQAELLSPEQVLAEMTRNYPYTAEAAQLAGNPFPATLRLRVTEVEQTRVVAAAAGMLRGVESVEFGAGYVDRALGTLRTVRAAGTLLIGLLLGVGGAALAGLILLPLAQVLTARATALVPALPLIQGWGPLLALWLQLAALGAGVGLLGGWLASGRYLRELE